MTTLEFKNRIASLYNINHDRLPELTDSDWKQFRDDPPRYLINLADWPQSEAIMREVERRQLPPEFDEVEPRP